VALGSDHGLLLKTEFQLVVFCTTIEVQIVFEVLLVLITGQLASLKERFTHRELDCFLGAGNRDDLGENVLVNKAAGDGFVLFWETVEGPEIEAFSCF